MPAIQLVQEDVKRAAFRPRSRDILMQRVVLEKKSSGIGYFRLQTIQMRKPVRPLLWIWRLPPVWAGRRDEQLLGDVHPDVEISRDETLPPAPVADDVAQQWKL
eukprot:4014392-Pyramimonas_sp.AAC.1